MGKVSRIPTIGDYTVFFNSLFFVLYSERRHKNWPATVILRIILSGTFSYCQFVSIGSVS